MTSSRTKANVYASFAYFDTIYNSASHSLFLKCHELLVAYTQICVHIPTKYVGESEFDSAKTTKSTHTHTIIIIICQGNVARFPVLISFLVCSRFVVCRERDLLWRSVCGYGDDVR